MKIKTLIAVSCVIVLIVCSNYIPSVLANGRPSAGTTWPPDENKIVYPINRRCVVTVDPLYRSTPVVAGSANIVTGFSAPNAVEGTLLSVDDQWLVIRSDRTENWVPRTKVLMIHLCE